ncbi:hypothetical protein I317_01403 [Kwoniella heveanensis CBS 569]|nr:hypothetical protein I317_01403 [Kwoniella heveanensis CBS 569]
MAPSVKPLEDGADRSIDARSIVVLVVFFIVNALVIWPVHVPLPLPHRLNKLLDNLSSRQGTGEDGRKMRDSDRVEEQQPAGSGVEQHRERSTGSAISDTAGGVETAISPTPVHPASSTPTSSSHTPPQTLAYSASSACRPSESQRTSSPPEPHRQPARALHFPLDLRTAPVIGVLLLLTSTCIPPSVVRRGIVGSAGVRPYDIMTLFICFAYISISLDSTGLLRYLAFLVASRSTSHGGGKTLYNGFYAFFALIGLFFGNDPLILSGTPFLAYFTDHASIQPPTAYIFTHFQVSNLVSALLVSSNPTNLVLTSAFGISFLSYSAWMALPTIASVIVLYPLLRWVVFRRKGLIPSTIHPPTLNPRDALIDPFGAIFGATIFVVTVVVLVGLSAGHLLEGTEGVWTVTAPAAALVLLRDLWRDWHMTRQKKHSAATPMEKVPSDDSPNRTVRASLPSSSSLTAKIQSTFPTTSHIISSLPLALLPFAFSFFILVEGLQHTGWIRVFGGWWISWMNVGGVAGGVWLMGTLSVIGCNIFGTNIGATILFARILQYWATSPTNVKPVSSRELYGAVFALATGSNFGAYSVVFSASLAGLLWRKILGDKGLTLTITDFARWNILPLAVTMIVGCLVVAGEVCVMYKD